MTSIIEENVFKKLYIEQIEKIKNSKKKKKKGFLL